MSEAHSANTRCKRLERCPEWGKILVFGVRTAWVLLSTEPCSVLTSTGLMPFGLVGDSHCSSKFKLWLQLE